MCKPICGKLTVEHLAQAARTWLRGGKTTPKYVVAYYRDLYELSTYRSRQLRKLIVP